MHDQQIEGMVLIIESKPPDSEFPQARINSTEEAENVAKDTFYDQVQAAVEEVHGGMPQCQIRK